MLPFVFTFINFEDVFCDKPYTIDEIAKYFSTLHTGHLIQSLCKLNIAIWKSQKDFTIHNDLLKLYFTDEDLEKIHRYREKNKRQKPFVFHRQQLLIAIKLALLNSNKEGERKIDNKILGRYILSISDYLEKQNQPSSYIDLLVSIHFEFTRQQIARLGYFSHTENFIYAYTRALNMWLDIPFTDRGKELLKKFNIDVHKEFLNTVGLTIEEYLGFSILYSLNLFQLDVRTPNPEDFMLYWNYFENTKLSQEKKDILFKLLSQNIEDYEFNNQEAIQDKLRGTDNFEKNFLPIMENPIVNINENMAIITDPNYAIEKTTHGVYWILHNKFKEEKDEKERKRKLFALSNYYGTLHQEYVYQILIDLCDEIVEIPEKQGEKRADFVGIVHDGEEVFLFIIEAKKLSLPLPVVFDSQREPTVKKLKEVFLDDGFRQIFETIRKVQKGELEDLGLKNIDPKKVRSIYPLLILDTFITEESLNRKFYEEEFFSKLSQEINIHGNIPIAHPIFLCSGDLELLESIVKSREKDDPINFTNALFYRHNQLTKRHNIEQRQFIPNMFILGVSGIPDDLDTFWNTFVLLKHDNSKNKRLQEVFSRHTEKVKRMLFDTDSNSGKN